MLQHGVHGLASREPAFARVLKEHGMPEPRSSERGAQTLLRTIVGQQVSVAAARSMWSKLEAAFGSPPDLKKLLAATDEDLRAACLQALKISPQACLEFAAKHTWEASARAFVDQMADIRHADPRGDAAACADIYNHYIRDSPTTGCARKTAAPT